MHPSAARRQQEWPPPAFPSEPVRRVIYEAAASGLRSSRSRAVNHVNGPIAPAITDIDAIDRVRMPLSERSSSPVFARPGVGISVDVAASEFGDGGTYIVAPSGRRIDTEAMIRLLLRRVGGFAIASIEAPLADDDRPGFAALTRQSGDCVQIIADDLVTSQPGRMREAALRRSGNAVILKPNQRGTSTEVLRTWQTARQPRVRGVIATRSG